MKWKSVEGGAKLLGYFHVQSRGISRNYSALLKWELVYEFWTAVYRLTQTFKWLKIFMSLGEIIHKDLHEILRETKIERIIETINGNRN